jgi:hypothetical protein
MALSSSDLDARRRLAEAWLARQDTTSLNAYADRLLVRSYMGEDGLARQDLAKHLRLAEQMIEGIRLDEPIPLDLVSAVAVMTTLWKEHDQLKGPVKAFVEEFWNKAQQILLAAYYWDEPWRSHIYYWAVRGGFLDAGPPFGFSPMHRPLRIAFAFQCFMFESDFGQQNLDRRQLVHSSDVRRQRLDGYLDYLQEMQKQYPEGAPADALSSAVLCELTLLPWRSRTIVGLAKKLLVCQTKEGAFSSSDELPWIDTHRTTLMSVLALYRLQQHTETLNADVARQSVKATKPGQPRRR